MSNYIPLATKYRPRKFSDVIGQDITVSIITRGMQKNRLGAALLFSGTRGVGKTTIARILAKALRCDYSDPEPCGKCESCLGFLHGDQIDVIEIDAASNTGVEDVREIIESCRYKPASGKFKIFIIDEVHMLSKSAFNALLKTLEEPPEHAKFLLATTETYKIPETILSRVLKFDLKRIDQDSIAQYLSYICNQENVVANADVLSLIARAADGSIRDSLSILDQVINMSDNNRISVGNVRDLLGFSGESDIISLLNSILRADPKEAIKIYREIIKGNALCDKIATTLLDYVYAMSVMKMNIESAENVIGDEVIPQLNNLAKNTSLAALTRIWQMLLKGMEEISNCDRPEIVLEMIIIRIAYASSIPDLNEIISDICQNKHREKSNINGIETEKNTVEKISEKSDNVEQDTSEAESLMDETMNMFPEASLI